MRVARVKKGENLSMEHGRVIVTGDGTVIVPDPLDPGRKVFTEPADDGDGVFVITNPPGTLQVVDEKEGLK